MNLNLMDGERTTLSIAADASRNIDLLSSDGESHPLRDRAQFRSSEVNHAPRDVEGHLSDELR
jgi:hypothetical protein